MPPTRRRIGVVGAGFGLQVHVPGLRSEGWEVAAICSRSREKVQKAAADAGIDGIHTDPMELIQRDDLDAVAIITPPGSHYALAITALKAGKHVLCEKPLAINARQAAEMRDTAERCRRTAMVVHEFRYTPQRSYIKQLVSDGYIGKFQLCAVELFLDLYVSGEPRPLTWTAYESEGGGVLGAIGSHYIDAMRHWFGDVASVTGHLATLRPDLLDAATGRMVKSETDDTFAFLLKFINGGIATMTASFATTPSRGVKIAVMGDKGTVLAEHPGPNPLEDGVVNASCNGGPLRQLATPARYTPFNDPRDHRLMAFRMLVRDFNWGIEQGSSPEPSFTDGLRCQEVIDAVRESSKSGCTVHLC